MAATIASFENIVCRFIYLPTESDPAENISDQLHLTPNSINIHGRRMALSESLYVSGYSECKSTTSSIFGSGRGSDRDISVDSDEEDARQVQVTSNEASTHSIAQILSTATHQESSIIDVCGIFMLSYSYAHTLNQVLFHMPEVLEEAQVSLCIVSDSNRSPKSSNSATSSSPNLTGFPLTLGRLTVVAPPSLARDGQYLSVELLRRQGRWVVSNTECLSI
jgi:hypothetical protein